MRNKFILVSILGLCLSNLSCKTNAVNSDVTAREPSQAVLKTWLEGRPTATVDQVKNLTELYNKKAKPLQKTTKVAQPTFEQMQKIAHYIDFLNIPEKLQKQTVERLLESSTQFLFCDNLEDWTCLQSTPTLTPLASHRIETSAGLGTVVNVASPFKMNYFFTKQWYRSRKNLIGEAEVAIPDKPALAGELNAVLSQPWSRVSAAMYGIDGIGDIAPETKKANTSMLQVYQSILAQPNFRSVVDIKSMTKLPDNKSQLVFDYEPTQTMIDTLNKNQTLESSRVRLEYPFNGAIMHNKFFVFEKDKNKSVWTGTANISLACIGDENFANMAVYIQNTEIADSYLKEFEEMYNFAPVGTIKAPQSVGRFHRNKTPNTKRYFSFSDGTEVALHFSPTDDGEHRSILPMLLSAREGDVIRISMFGSSGVEYVRAIQYAVANGALVKVFMDAGQNLYSPGSWIHKDTLAKLHGANPYGAVKGSIEIRSTDWGGIYYRKNHHKSATLTRKTNSGFLPQVLIVGSQNWSVPGNDDNDENMLTIRNLKNGLTVVKDYNEHFDKMLWPTGKVVPLE